MLFPPWPGRDEVLQPLLLLLGQDQVVAYLLLLVVLEDLGLGTDLGLAYEHQNLSIPNIKI